jgi:hypothetical protein
MDSRKGPAEKGDAAAKLLGGLATLYSSSMTSFFADLSRMKRIHSIIHSIIHSTIY